MKRKETFLEQGLEVLQEVKRLLVHESVILETQESFCSDKRSRVTTGQSEREEGSRTPAGGGCGSDSVYEKLRDEIDEFKHAVLLSLEGKGGFASRLAKLECLECEQLRMAASAKENRRIGLREPQGNTQQKHNKRSESGIGHRTNSMEYDLRKCSERTEVGCVFEVRVCDYLVFRVRGGMLLERRVEAV